MKQNLNSKTNFPKMEGKKKPKTKQKWGMYMLQFQLKLHIPSKNVETKSLHPALEWSPAGY